MIRLTAPRAAPATPAAAFLFPLLAGAALGSIVGPAPAAAQIMRGVIVQAESGLPMGGVDVLLLDTAGAPVKIGASDRTGRFALVAPEPGTYRIRATQLGYDDVLSEDLVIRGKEVVEVEVRLGVRPIELEGLSVVGRRKREGLAERDLREYRERLADYPHYVGIRIFTPEALDDVHGWSLADVMELRPGRRCSPVIYWNGMRKKSWEVDTRIPIESLQAVEFWSGYFAPNSNFSDMSGCGVMLVWTR